MAEATQSEPKQQDKRPQGEQPAAPATQKAGEQPGQQGGLTRRQGGITPSLWTESPFAFMRRFSEEMDRLFEDFTGRSWPSLRWGGRGRESGQAMWSPQIEVCERDGKLEVAVDLPGLKKDDIKVEFTNDVLTIQGERRQEYEETKEGFRRSERSYGSFYRSIPLPEGVDPEKATASFQDGVLKITMPLPQQEERRGRRIEIQ